MLFQFAPLIQAGIETGKYVQVFSNGVPIGMVRDAVNGHFVAHAIGFTVNNSPLSPLVATSQFLTSGLQMYQTHRGFTDVLNGLQTIQTSLGVLQATTALIGVGTVAGVALTAVNLHQTLKLRKDEAFREDPCEEAPRCTSFDRFRSNSPFYRGVLAVHRKIPLNSIMWSRFSCLLGSGVAIALVI